MNFKNLELQSLSHLLARSSPSFSTAKPPIAVPVRNWHLILLVAALALAVVVAAASTFYWLELYSNAPATVGATSPQTIDISESALNTTLAHYQMLDAEHADLLKSGSAVADPASTQ
ncbi:MAG: hypothetical protein ACREGH_03720 [Minisyncoccia bacterium]